jgi:hypothetical protein
MIGFHGCIGLSSFHCSSISFFMLCGIFCFRFWAPSHSEIERMNFAASLCRRVNIRELITNAPVYSSASGTTSHYFAGQSTFVNC